MFFSLMHFFSGERPKPQEIPVLAFGQVLYLSQGRPYHRILHVLDHLEGAVHSIHTCFSMYIIKD
jgi:hypothetical protein